MLLEIALSFLLALGASFLVQLFFFRKLGGQISGALDSFIEKVVNPQTKRAFTHLASMGGDAKAVKEIQGKLAKGAINKNYGLLKIAAEKFLGIDVDDLIEEYGAPNILQAIQGMGLDLSSFTGNGLEGLNIGLAKGNTGENPYLRR